MFSGVYPFYDEWTWIGNPVLSDLDGRSVGGSGNERSAVGGRQEARHWSELNNADGAL